MVMVKRPLTRLVTIVTAAIGSGLVGSAVIGSWFGMLPGNYWMHALVLGTGALAFSAVISGLGTLLGYGGMGLGIIFMMLIGTPWGGVMMPTKFLPDFMGGLGFHMPTGTVVNLMKSVSYFPEAATGAQWWTLIAWIAGEGDSGAPGRSGYQVRERPPAC